MPTRNFRELRDAIPAERRRRVDQRVRETIAAMPPGELRRAHEQSQAGAASARDRTLEQDSGL